MGDPGLTHVPTLHGLRGRQENGVGGKPPAPVEWLGDLGMGGPRASGVPLPLVSVLADLGHSARFCVVRELVRLLGLLT